MTYAKPEVGVLGDAARVIEATNQKTLPSSLDGGRVINPAYDLDE